jgi:GT2 family glycosyltransferase
LRYHRNASRCGLPRNRNTGIELAKGAMVLFIEDDMVMKPDCIEILLNSFKKLKANGINVGAIAPSLVVKFECGESDVSLLDFAYRRENKELKVPCFRDERTGLIHLNFTPNFKRLQEVEEVHACSLYPRNVFDEIGLYNFKRFRGNYLYEESDLNFRIRRNGYKLFFEPGAIMHHRIQRRGGCRVAPLTYVYYFMKNHAIFVAGNYGFKALYILPCFSLLILFKGFKSLPFINGFSKTGRYYATGLAN